MAWTGTGPGIAAATFAAVFAALYAAHSVADHWVQREHQAIHKGAAGWAGWAANLRHVATLTITQLAAVLVLVPALGLRLSGWQLAAGLTVNAVSLLVVGQAVAADLSRSGQPLTRDALGAGVRDRGHSCSTTRAQALLAAVRGIGEDRADRSA